MDREGVGSVHREGASGERKGHVDGVVMWTEREGPGERGPT